VQIEVNLLKKKIVKESIIQLKVIVLRCTWVS